MSQYILSEANHEPCFVHLFLQIHVENTTYFLLCLEIISYTSFLMINYYSLIIASFIDGKVSINDVTQPCYTTRVCPRPLGSLAILFFILSYLSYPRSSSFEVDLLLSEALSSITVSLTLGASDSCLLDCHHLFFGTGLVLLFLQEVVQDLSMTSLRLCTNPICQQRGLISSTRELYSTMSYLPITCILEVYSH